MEAQESYLDKELLETAVSFVKDGEKVPREVKDRVQMAISLDNRNHLLRLNGRVDKVENHFLHSLTPRRIAALSGGFIALSSVYIQESRSFLVDLAIAILTGK